MSDQSDHDIEKSEQESDQESEDLHDGMIDENAVDEPYDEELEGNTHLKVDR